MDLRFIPYGTDAYYKGFTNILDKQIALITEDNREFTPDEARLIEAGYKWSHQTIQPAKAHVYQGRKDWLRLNEAPQDEMMMFTFTNNRSIVNLSAPAFDATDIEAPSPCRKPRESYL
ncbi:hypothetical protein J6590_034958 [Homalodisca vitripennis]|nr:hypothetical protein J6590_034958 [Homalodisca vitripennis]